VLEDSHNTADLSNLPCSKLFIVTCFVEDSISIRLSAISSWWKKTDFNASWS